MDIRDFLNYAIDDGIEGARLSYLDPNKQLHFLGALKGFNECRDRDQYSLKILLDDSELLVRQKFGKPDYWYWRCRNLEIEWIVNVISAVLYISGEPAIVMPTVRGLVKATELIGNASNLID